MTDVSEMSDAELLAHYAMPSLVKQESGGRAGVIGPQTKYGRAEGMTQMLPATAQATAEKLGMPWRPELMRGTSSEAAQYQEALGRAYLQQGIAETGNLQDGLRYYHGGPDRRQWGPKTENYARSISANLSGQAAPQADLSGLSDDELMAMYKGNRGPAPGSVKPPQRGAAPVASPPAAKRPAPAQAQPGMMDLAASGFMQPFRDLGNAVDARRAKLVDRAKAPPAFSLPGFAQQTFEDLGDTAGLVGGILGLSGAPVQAAVRPAAAVTQRAIGNPTQAPQLTMQGGRPGLTKPRQMGDAEGRQAIEGAINSALSAARPSTAKPSAVAAPKPMDLEAMRAADEAAWRKVDASGYRFPQTDVQTAAADIRKIVADAGPELYPEATRVAARVEALAKRGDLTPAQANRLRSQVGEKLLTPGSTEVSVGSDIKARIDALIDGGNAPELKAARQGYMQLKKMEDVSNRIASGELAQETGGTGGNQNAVRQKLRPTIDPKSPQRIRNFTNDEAAAVRKVTKGTPTQNALRLLTAFDPTAGKLQALLSTGAAGLSGGTSLAMMPVGMAAKLGERAIGAKNLQGLIDLISTGGVRPAPIPGPSVLGPFAPLTGPSRLLGAGVVGAPLLPKPVERPRSKSTAKAATTPRRK